jgi:hypothetical protein
MGESIEPMSNRCIGARTDGHVQMMIRQVDSNDIDRLDACTPL